MQRMGNCEHNTLFHLAAPEGMVCIPALAGGAPDLSSFSLLETPYGKIWVAKPDAHPFVEECIARTIDLHWMDAEGRWSDDVPQGVKALWVKMYYDMIGFPLDWKYFELRWGIAKLRTLLMPKHHRLYEMWRKEWLNVFLIDTLT